MEYAVVVGFASVAAMALLLGGELERRAWLGRRLELSLETWKSRPQRIIPRDSTARLEVPTATSDGSVTRQAV